MIAVLARVPQACEMLSCSKGTLYTLLRTGAIRSFKDGRVRKIEIASIQAFIERGIAADKWASQSVGQGVGQSEEQ